jgi:hypothetical protein
MKKKVRDEFNEKMKLLANRYFYGEKSDLTEKITVDRVIIEAVNLMTIALSDSDMGFDEGIFHYKNFIES